MCEVHCTGEEQAAILGIDYDTLNRACKREKKCSFAEYFKQKSSGGKMSLRRRQFTTAMDGNPTMLIWLGKMWLGQQEVQQVEQKTTISEEEVDKRLKQLLSNAKWDILRRCC